MATAVFAFQLAKERKTVALAAALEKKKGQQPQPRDLTLQHG